MSSSSVRDSTTRRNHETKVRESVSPVNVDTGTTLRRNAKTRACEHAGDIRVDTSTKTEDSSDSSARTSHLSLQ